MKPLPLEARHECLYLARKTLHAHVRNQEQGPAYQPRHPVMMEPRGAFVTLHHKGELRGCIGYLQAHEPLWQTIEECTVAAASRDPRFSPVEPAELTQIKIEISVLSPLQTIQDVAEIEVGVHGILITRGIHRGVLLPQVATERGWNREEFLANTCRKAGLPANAWHHDCQIEIFRADVFAEDE